MDKECGNISVNTQNILPIIKRWLYSDKDIFVRELISNGCDAISKFKRIVSIGEADAPDDTKYEIKVIVSKKEKTIEFIDNGIGMTAEEVKKYINQVAFSGAEDFIKKYNDKLSKENDIIGHFGLGFYSSFMVSELVEIDTLSYEEGAEAVRWSCDGGTKYEIQKSERKERGTSVILHIDRENEEFLDEAKLKSIINKHCYFLPVEIYLNNKDDEKKKEDEKPLNDIHPLWLKAPKDCTEEEYKEFYKKVFHEYEDPLFWIHLNVDYPFNLKGILYFPKLDSNFNVNKGEVKLYNNQVYVADNVKEIIPEFLLVLKGTIDCSDLPLNVSRNVLQRDSNVIKISRHITNKVGDKLNDLFKNEREKYNKCWNDINPFIKYGCIRDEKFYEMVKDIIIYRTINDEYITLNDYIERSKDKNPNKIFYVTDADEQSQYISIFKQNGIEAIILDSPIDNHFISFLEYKQNEIKFNRIDSDLCDTLKAPSESDNENQEEKEKSKKSLEELFKSALNKENLDIKAESLKSEDVPAIFMLEEQSRRMNEMSMMYAKPEDKNSFTGKETLVLNLNNKLIRNIAQMSSNKDKEEDLKLICIQVYDLAVMGSQRLQGDEMSSFIKRSNHILEKFAIRDTH